MPTKILILTSRFPYPIEKGDKLRIYRQIKGLAASHDIVLCALTEQDIAQQDYKELEQYCSKIYTFPLGKTDIARNMLSGFLRGLPLQVAYFYKKSIHKKINQIIAKEKPDYLYCQLARMAEYARHTSIPNTIDYMDAFSVNARRWSNNAPFYLRPFLSREARKMAEYESLIFDDFKGHSIISAQDREHLNIKERQKIQVIPNGVDFDFFQSAKTTNREYDLVFVGNMGYAPNVKAARYLATEVLPLVHAQMPDLRLMIAGARPAPEVQRLQSEQVNVTGWMDDIRDAYNGAEIFAAPLFTGAGLQNKILEAMAMGVPCITTSLVNNAIGAKHGESILLADDAQAFANAIIQLKENKTQRDQISQQAKMFVRQNFDWATFVAQLRQLITKSK